MPGPKGNFTSSWTARMAVSVSALMFAQGAYAQGETPLPASESSGVPPRGDATATVGSPAGPPEQVGTLQEVVVTAQRRAENLQSVPISVTAIDGEALVASGVSATADLPLLTPGLTFTNGVGHALPRIRGIGTSATGAGIESPVSMYVDGVYIASTSSALTSLNNVQQIAVLKGPQGTLFGRNATGGLIQITTRTPSETFGGNVSAGYGNHETLSGGLYVTNGLAPGVAADLAVYYHDQGQGFGKNLFNGKDVGDGTDFAARSKLRAELGEDTTVTVAADYSDRRAALPAFRIVDGTVAITGATRAGGQFDVNSNVQPLLTDEQRGVSLTAEHGFGSFTAASITAYRESSSEARFDGDKLPQSLGGTDIFENNRQFSQELQLTAEQDSRLQWVLGAYYFNATGKFDPVLITTPGGVIRLRGQQDTDSIAGYGQATYPVFDATNFTAGFRYTSELRSADIRNQLTTPAGIALPASASSGDKRYKRPTWRLALDHHFSDDLLGYVSYNRGFKSGGFNVQALPATPFDPEILDAYEAGVKVDLFSRSLRFNAATFYYDYQNIQVTAFIDGLNSIYNAASAKIYGIDADVTIAPTERWTITLGASGLHDRFGNFPNASIATPRPTGGNIVSTGSATGNRMPLTPDYTINAAIDYSVPLGLGSVDLNASYLHSDGWFAEPDNLLRQEPYDILNISATWFLNSDRGLSVKAWGKNVTDEVYAAQMNAQANSSGVTVAPGRNFGVTLDYKF